MCKRMFKLAFCFSLAFVSALAMATDGAPKAHKKKSAPKSYLLPEPGWETKPAAEEPSFLLPEPGLETKAAPPVKKSTPPVKAAAIKPKVAAPAPVVVVPKVTYTKQVAEARRLYENGKYPAAAQVYERIPANSTEFLRTREELAWTYLRQENWLKLRGLLPDLNSKLVPLRWRLEGRVLSAMLYLKDCEYEKVRSEMELFQDELQPMAHVVDRRMTNSTRPEYWRALHAEMDEAIFKMKFVRMELRSRLVMLTRQQVIDTPDRKDVRERITAGAQVYPANGDVWVDELFSKRGEGKSVCASLHNQKVLQ